MARTYVVQTNAAGTNFGTKLASKTKETIESYTDVTIDAAHSVPIGVNLKPRNGAKYLISGSGAFSFLGAALQGVERRQIFQGATAGSIIWRGAYPDVIYPEWFGIKGNDTTVGAANSAAWYVLMEALQGLNNSGAYILFSNQDYDFADVIEVNRQCTIDQIPGGRLFFGRGVGNKGGIRCNGEMTHGNAAALDHTSTTKITRTGSKASTSGATFNITLTSAISDAYSNGVYWFTGAGGFGGRIGTFSGNQTVIPVQVLSITNPGTIAAASGVDVRLEIYKSASQAHLKNLHLVGAVGAMTHTVSIAADLILTKSAGENFDANNKYLDGYTVSLAPESGQDGGRETTYVLDHYPSQTTTTTKIKPYRMMITRQFDLGSTATYLLDGYAYVSSRWVGATLKLIDRGTSHTITAVAGDNQITLDTDVEYTGEAEITALDPAKFTGVSARFNRYSGLDARIQVITENLRIEGFAGHGYEANNFTNANVSNPSNPAQPNNNNAHHYNLRCFSNKAAGIYNRGVNANNQTFFHPDTQNNAIGIYDEGQHPNTHILLHSSYDTQGHFGGNIGIQGVQFINPYVEGGAPAFRLGLRASIRGIGGNYPQNASGGTEQFIDSQTGMWRGSPVEAEWTSPGGGQDPSSTVTHFYSRLGNRTYKVVQEFGSFDANNLHEKLWMLLNNQQGRYGWAYFPHSITGNLLVTPYDPAMEFTTADEPDLPEGELIFPKGIIFQSPDGTYFRLTVSNAGAAVFTEIT